MRLRLMYRLNDREESLYLDATDEKAAALVAEFARGAAAGGPLPSLASDSWSTSAT